MANGFGQFVGGVVYDESFSFFADPSAIEGCSGAKLCPMADAENAAEPEWEGASARSGESLSQFVARVLDQLSVSAWLPSAALVLLVAFVVQLGAVLDSEEAPDDPVEAAGRAFRAMGETTVGGALMLAAAVIVLTMVTQAFSLESIRLLEGWVCQPVLAPACSFGLAPPVAG